MHLIKGELYVHWKRKDLHGVQTAPQDMEKSFHILRYQQNITVVDHILVGHFGTAILNQISTPSYPLIAVLTTSAWKM